MICALMPGSLLDQYLQSFVAASLAVVLLGLRVAVRNPEYNDDLRGASRYFVASVGTQLLTLFVEGVLWIPSFTPYFEALKLLLFCFGWIRLLIGSIIWVFRGRRDIHTPKIVRDVLDGVVYAICLVVVLRATLKVDLASLVATSAALSVVAGLALQETLGNLFAGLSLQVEHPFQVGDWVGINEHTGRVVQVAWRGTKLETLRREQVTLPNGTIAKANVVNFSRHGQVASELSIGLDYRCAPTTVKQIIREVLASLPSVLKDPPPSVQLRRFDESAMTYQVRFFVKGFDAIEDTVDVVLSTLWYRFRRDGVDIPFPHRVIELNGAPPASGPLNLAPSEKPTATTGTASRNEIRVATERADTLALLEQVDFLKPLGASGRAELAERVLRQQFGAGEVILRAGEVGDSFHVVAQGQVSVVARVGEKEQEVAKLKRGEFFGEMSLLTGEPRSATVIAGGDDATLLSMSRAAFGEVLAAHSSVAQDLADILGRRRAELDKAKEGESSNSMARAESKRIFGRLRELFNFKVAGE
jgi:small-conductance mechanosensitive channel/CRP-like cAMP-binding protein